MPKPRTTKATRRPARVKPRPQARAAARPPAESTARPRWPASTPPPAESTPGPGSPKQRPRRSAVASSKPGRAGPRARVVQANAAPTCVRAPARGVHTRAWVTQAKTAPVRTASSKPRPRRSPVAPSANAAPTCVPPPPAPAPPTPEFIEGRHPVLEALRAGRPINRIVISGVGRHSGTAEILHLAQRAGVVVDRVDAVAMDRLSPRGKHQGVVAFAAAKDYAGLHELLEAARAAAAPALIAVLDGITDPQNLGAIIRTVEGAGTASSFPGGAPSA